VQCLPVTFAFSSKNIMQHHSHFWVLIDRLLGQIFTLAVPAVIQLE